VTAELTLNSWGCNSSLLEVYVSVNVHELFVGRAYMGSGENMCASHHTSHAMPGSVLFQKGVLMRSFAAC
jgi:hypothetical protein